MQPIINSSSPKRFFNACLGNLFDHYETALFGFLSPILAPLMFPQHDPVSALILTYAIMPLAMLARPLGALLFGYIGDAYGRERSLSITLGGMALVSGCIAFTPTYLQAGILSPILFGLGRAMQNFLAAGETMGGGIYVLENTSQKRQDVVSGIYGASAMGGHLLASYGVYAISSQSAGGLGWRFLYLCGCATALFGYFIRRSSLAIASSISIKKSFQSLKLSLIENRKTLLIIIVCSGFANATYSIGLVFMNGFVPLVSDVTKTEIMKINTYLLVLDFCALPFFGWIASKVSRERWMLSVALITILFSMPLMMALEGAGAGRMIAIRIAFVMLGVAFFGPFHAWVQQIVSPNSRYAVISFGYAIGSQLLGSPTAAFALWCYQKTGSASSVAWYWMALGLASAFSILKATQKNTEFGHLKSPIL